MPAAPARGRTTAPVFGLAREAAAVNEQAEPAVGLPVRPWPDSWAMTSWWRPGSGKRVNSTSTALLPPTSLCRRATLPASSEPEASTSRWDNLCSAAAVPAAVGIDPLVLRASRAVIGELWLPSPRPTLLACGFTSVAKVHADRQAWHWGCSSTIPLALLAKQASKHAEILGLHAPAIQRRRHRCCDATQPGVRIARR